MPTLREIKVGAMLVAIFALGAVCGALWMQRRPDPPAEVGRREAIDQTRLRVLESLRRELRLDGVQESGVSNVLAEWGREVSLLGPGRFPEKLELLDRMAERVRTNLSTTQIPAFDRRLGTIRNRLQRFAE